METSPRALLAPRETLQRFIDYDERARLILIRFPYDAELVQVVRTLPRRRWNGQERVWTVPSTQASRAWQSLKLYGFRLSPSVAELIGLDPSSEVVHQPAAARPQPQGPGLTVRGLNQMARAALKAAIPRPVWVVGELLGFDRGRRRTGAFFELVERREEELVGRVQGVAWGETLAALEAKTRAADPPFSLCDGLMVRLLVSVELYEPSGRFQIVVHDLDPVYTLGSLALKREAIFKALDEAGVRHQNLRRALPSAPLRIALLTSAESAAVMDFTHELARSGLGFKVDLYPVKVQGKRLAPSVIAALKATAKRAKRYDVVVITRGGGSRTDLLWFDDLQVALAVATHPVKVLIGIGHQHDKGVLDEIAASEKTPTAVAAALVKAVLLGLAALEEGWLLIQQQAEARLSEASKALNEYGEGVTMRAELALRGLGLDLEALAQGLKETSLNLTRKEGRRLGATAIRLSRLAERPLRQAKDDWRQAATDISLSRAEISRRARSVEDLFKRLERAAPMLCSRQERALSRAERELELLDPRRVLARGYAILYGKGGRVVTSASHVEQGASLDIALRDGQVRAIVEDIECQKEEAPLGEEGWSKKGHE